MSQRRVYGVRLVISLMSNFLLSKCHSLGIGGVHAVQTPSTLVASMGSQNGTLFTNATNSRCGRVGFLASLRMHTSGVAACPSSNTHPPRIHNAMFTQLVSETLYSMNYEGSFNQNQLNSIPVDKQEGLCLSCNKSDIVDL